MSQNNGDANAALHDDPDITSEVLAAGCAATSLRQTRRPRTQSQAAATALERYEILGFDLAR